MDLKQKRISFIGGGRMAEALIKGLVSAGVVPPKNISASDTAPERLKHLRAKYGIKAVKNSADIIDGAGVIVLCVKPQIIKDVLADIGGKIHRSQLVISVAAGITARSIKKFVKKSPIIRVMPNNPCLVGEGISVIARGSAGRDVEDAARKIFGSVGEVLFADESRMDAATALSGSGPAFLYLAAEAMIEGGKLAGLSSAESVKLALQTMLGSAKTLIKSGKTPEELRAMVTSPGGTTQAGLEILEKKGFKKALVSAILRAAQRSAQLGKIFNP